VISKQRADRTEDELKANLHSLTLVAADEDLIPEAEIQEEETTFRIEDIPLNMELPQRRFNAALAVGMDDKLYIYGGTYEKPGRGEVTLDDFHVIDLGRLDGIRELWNRTSALGDESSEDDSDDDEDDKIDEDESTESQGEGGRAEDMEIDTPLSEPEPPLEAISIQESTTTFNPSYPQPFPFESLKSYYDRTTKDWLLLTSNKSKAGRREAFIKAEGYWWECREEIREIEEQMEESGVKEVVVGQIDRKDKRR
jgi:Domain of unknown function (DUF4110)